MKEKLEISEKLQENTKKLILLEESEKKKKKINLKL